MGCCGKVFINNFVLIVTSGIIVLIAALLNYTPTSTYGQIIFNETNEWGLGAVEDIISSDT